MVIYTVRQGDNLYSLARKYGVTVDSITYANQLANPSQLVIGQSLVIPADSLQHIVRSGQTLYSIAGNYGVTVESILSANPQITNPNRIRAGQTITIPFSTPITRSIDVNGYALAGISSSVLAESLPYLTYLSMFAYMTDEYGELTGIDDSSEIAAAYEQNVAPLMVIVNTRETGGFSSDIAHAILTNQTAQDNFIANMLEVLENKGYYGVNIDFEYVYPFDRESYNQFLRRLADTLHPRGYILSTALAPKISAQQQGTLYTAHDYRVHGEVADFVIIMTYEWGYTYGPAMAVSPIDKMRQVLDYAVSEIPSGKILMSLPNYAYDWTLPFVQGSRAENLSNVAAVTLAARVGAQIQFDQTSQTPFFNYYDEQGRRHEVWFEDARSLNAKLKLIEEYDLAGVSFWSINRLFRTNWLVIQSMYGVNKVL